MDQDFQEPSTRLSRRSFNYERLARINQDPFEVPVRPRSRISESPRRIFNYVKDKVQGAVTGLQKLLNSPRSSQSKTATPVSSYQLPPIANEKFSDISSSINQTVSKPEYQRHYGVGSHRSENQKKTSFLGVMNFYKDVSGEKIREQMREANTLVIPPLSASVTKSVSLASPTKSVKESIKPARRYLDQSDDLYRRESVSSNGKRPMPSILSKREKRLAKKAEEEKKVRFLPESRLNSLPKSDLSLVRSNSSMIKYISSDDDEEFEKSQKKVFGDDQTGIIKDPPLKISIIKKIKINPFQKSRVEKTSVSEYLRSVKGMKGKGFDKFVGGKLNHENSYGSDNILNDSKIETDSDESSLLHNNFESRDFNNYKGHEDRDEELSEISQKGGEDAFPEKAESPILENVEEQDIEKEESNYGEEEEEIKQSPVQMQKEQKEEKVVTPVEPEPIAKPVVFSGLFGQKEIKPVIEEKIATPVNQPLVENSEPTKPKLFSFGNSILPKEPVATPVVPQETIAPSKPSAISQLLQSVVEEKDDKKDEIVPSVPATESSNLPRSGSLFSEEALKNPLFAGLVNNSKTESAMSDNPFLNKPIQKTLSFTNLISATSSAAPKTETVEEKPQTSENAFTNPVANTNANPFTSGSQPSGILGILQRAQSTVSDTGASGMFSNTLKPVGSFSWMGSNNSNNQDSQPANNLFGNMASNNQSQGAQPQNNVFGNLFSNNNNNSNGNVNGNGNGNTAGSGMAFESGNSMMGEAESNNNNNNTGSLFGGNSGLNFGNNNSGSSVFGGNNLFQNSGSSSMFGGNSFNQNNNSNPFTSGGIGNNGFQADSSNPFLSQGSGSGASNLFGQGSSQNNNNSFGGNSGFGGGNFGSGKKGKNQRERAF